MKLSEYFIPCKRHIAQGIKFVEVSEGKFDGLCDICMVSSEFMSKSMKLERLVDIYDKKKKEIIKT